MAPAKISWLKFLALILLAGLIYLNYTDLATTNLNPEEACYWKVTQHLTPKFWGDSPLTALLIYGATQIGGANQFAIHFPALLSWALFMFGIPKFIEITDYNASAAGFVLLTALFTPVLVFANPLSTPDLLLLVLTLPAWYFSYQAIEAGQSGSWYGAGIFWGLAVLTRPQAFLIGLTVFIMLLIRPSKWKLLGYKEPYLAAVLGLVMSVPVYYWYWRQGWFNFVRYPVVWSDPAILLHTLKQSGVAFLSTFSLLSLPLFYYTLKHLLTFRHTTGSEYFLIGAYLVPSLYWVYTSFGVFGKTPAPLPVVIYLPALLFAARQLYKRLRQPGVITKAFWIGLILINLVLNGLAFTTVRYPRLVSDIEPQLPAVVLAKYFSMVNSTRGWSKLGRTVDRIRRDSSPEALIIPVVASSYQLAAELDYYVTSGVDLIIIPSAVRNRYGYLTAEHADQIDRQPGLLVSDQPFIETWNTYFSQVKLLETINRTPGGKIECPVYIYRFEALNAEKFIPPFSDKTNHKDSARMIPVWENHATATLVRQVGFPASEPRSR